MRLAALVLLCGVAAFARRHPRTDYHGKEPETHWVVYRPHHFEDSELCSVLNCRNVEVCLVRHNNAMCVNKHRLSRIEGEKVEFEEIQKARQSDRTSSLHIKAKLEAEKAAKAQRSAPKEHHAKEPHHPAPHHPAPHHKKAPKKTNRISQRHSHEEVEKDCNAKELREMGGRLLQWFSDVHSVTAESDAKPTHLGRHRVSCRQDVGWMFSQLDGNSDGFLTIKELVSLERDPYESCVRPFLDRCDAARVDDRLSVDEWCDCFNFADKLEREEPPCHKKQHAADPHLLGQWVPRCDADGFFRPEQCHENQCWCTDRWGREFDHSRVHERADCGQYAEEGDDEDLEEIMGSYEL